jgi:hypothetical protein
MKETPRRRLTVTLSLNEMSTDPLENRGWVRGEASGWVRGGGLTPPVHALFYSKLLDFFPPPRIFASWPCMAGKWKISTKRKYSEKTEDRKQ